MQVAGSKASFWRIAIPAVIAIVALGGLSGYLSNSGYSNPWFAALEKPAFMPPGWLCEPVGLVLVTTERPRKRIAFGW